MNRVKQTIAARRNSLFVKLLGSFLLPIALLLSFNVLSFAFFQTNIQNEIISHNTLNLNNTVNGYEKQLQLVESDMMRFYFNEKFGTLVGPGGEPNYSAVPAVKSEMNALLSNEMLHLDNLFILFRDHSFVMEKESTTNAVNMFTKFYVGDRYDLSFWQRQFGEPYTFRVYPSARFREYKYDKTVVDKGELLPVVIKNKFSSQYIVAALLDAQGMYRSLHHNGEDGFFVLGPNGETLFRAGPGREASGLPDALLPPDARFRGESGYRLIDDRYYFYKRGAGSSLLYVNVVPNERIAAQVERLNWALLLLMGTAVAASVLLSVWFSVRINNPIQSMVRLLQKTDQPRPLRSSIREFDFLGSRISDILRDNLVFDQDLRRKNKLLQTYGYMSKIKSIHHWNDLRDLIEMSRPFYLIAYELTITRPMPAEDQEKTAYRVHELIDAHMSGAFADSVTLQMEKEQFLSLLFATDDAGAVTETLRRLKDAFDRNREFGFVTIAFRAALRTGAELAAAYEEAQAMIRLRRLNRETQIVSEPPREERDAAPTSAQEQELAASVLGGSGDKAAGLIGGLLRQLEQGGAGAGAFAELGKQLAALLLKLLLEHRYDISRLLGGQSPFLLLKQCWSVGEYERLFRRFAEDAAKLVRERKEERDPIRDFVLDYVANHYGEDLSLELVADKLNLSRGYLSTYFHEKTGRTFSEYVNGLRMERAKHMLSETDTRIQDIAAEIGYRNVNSFIRMFKRMCGLTPGEFRRVALRHEAEAD
ncbi:helix-turn-helix domain-containing protein [Paenibacillus sp. GYB003]|uniref:helix-turn-helix domain-containing protein n=1 Tax=Paenibacillus sp. GYB003 TaxID=2994392 RepID=UPI002F96CCF6